MCVNDALLLAASGAAVAVGLASCVALVRLGMATTHVRDLLHVGAGVVWVMTWRWWSSPVVPVALVAVVAAGTALVPALARRSRAAASLMRSVASGDELWSGLTAYTFAVLVFTACGFFVEPVSAAAAIAALALGDGIGGAAGRRFGRVRYAVPWGKPKSLEGSLAVAVGAAAGAAAAAWWLGAPMAAWLAVAAGVVAALAEAAAPRAGDNLLVPAAVWMLLSLVG